MLVGWMEKVELRFVGPERHSIIVELPAKMDTGASGCALHADEVKLFTHGGKRYVSFIVAGYKGPALEARFRGWKTVRSSNGAAERRCLVRAEISLGGETVLTTLSLSNRSTMEFPCLLGRRYLRGRYLVDSAEKCLLG